MYAETAVNLPGLAATYHYSVPDDLRGRLTAGHLATIPFAGRRAQAIILSLSAAAPRLAGTGGRQPEFKAIEGLVDPAPVLTRAQLDLAQWIAHTYVTPLIECLTLMLPPGLAKRADVLYSPLGADSRPALAQPVQQSLQRLLDARGPLRGRQIDRALPRTNWRAAAEALVRRGWLTRQSVLDPPSVRAKHIRTARLAATLQQIEAARPRLSRSPAKAARLSAVLDFLANEFDPVDVSWVYAETRSSLPDLKDLAEMGLVDLGEAEIWRDSLAGKEFVPVEPPVLTRDQKQAWEEIQQRIEWMAERPAGESVPSAGQNVFLLHGVTGSGKTEIYLRALAETLKQGRRAIVLVPEIALTPQTVRRFASRFPGRVAVWHSQLGEGERYDTWRRARAGLVDVVVGARSALFAPLPDLGLIVLDEEHDEAYKQDPPFAVPYHARAAALQYARQTGAVCLLGSATPDITTYFHAKQGEYRLLELPQRIMGHARRLHELADQLHVEPRYRPVAEEDPGSASGEAAAGRRSASEAQYIDLPPVEVVDLRQELRAGNTSIFSRRLQAALTATLERGEQAILFLNRRGTATYVFCRDCGEALQCGRCEMPLTQHGAQALVCHHCGYQRQMPEQCPRCGGRRIKHFGTGTEKVEEAVRAAFPQARTIRWDQDVTRFKGAHELILNQFSSQQANVLIGTQMIAKGLDLPLVTLVGVISADVGLGLPDYRAAERTFQVLTQVAGRAGRGLLGGRVVLQTYLPEHYALQAAAQHNYAEFFARELRYRKDLGYPPFRRLARLVYRHSSAPRAESEAGIVARQLHNRISKDRPAATDIVGPTPCFFEKIAGEYRWQIIVRSPDPAALLRSLTLKGWHIDVDPVNTL